MRACQHRQSRQRRQPPPTLTKHSTPKVAGNSPRSVFNTAHKRCNSNDPISMFERFTWELHAKLQGAHRTTVPHSATSSARASPHSNSQRLDTHMAPPQHARMHKTAPASSLLREGTRPGPGRGVMFHGATIVQPTRRMCPDAVSDQPAATTIREIKPSM